MPTELPRSAASPWRGRLVALAGLLVVALNARIMVAVVSPITGLINQDIPLTESHEQLIGLAAPLSFAVFGAVTPALGRRYGLEAMMIVSLLISVVGEAARAFAPSPVWFIIWTIPALTGAGMGNVITPPLIKKYFPDRVSAVTALYTFFATISTSLPPLTILSLAERTGWRFSLGIWAVLGLIGVIPWLFVVFSADRAGQRLAAIKRRLDPRTTVAAAPRLTQPLWKTPVAWALTLALAVNSLLGYTLFAWFPRVLRDAGVSTERAALYLAIFAAGSLPGTLVTPLLTARAKRTWVLPAVFFASYAVSFTALAVAPGSATLAWILLSRIGDCFYPWVLTMINLRTRSTRGSIAMSGFVQPMAYAIASLGPWGFGWLHTVAGNWHVPMLALVLFLPLQFLGGYVAGRAKPVA
ncbi:MAG: MFS transporter [Propionibacteriaceae bacterium]|jgi:CP family cyanate transporter-like MFS transporter|nr:MFS transporter [Propionibacteriaceae bacterium]